MIPSDLDIVNWTAALYNPQPGDFDRIIQVNPLAPYIGIKHGDGWDFLGARGSMTAADWFRDSQSELGVAVRGYETLGMLPWGFARGMADTWIAVAAELQPNVPLVGGGHSLGGPEIYYQSAAAILAGRAIAKIRVYECPKPGTAALIAFFRSIDATALHNDLDPVPDLPEPVPLLLPWVPPAADPILFSLGPSPSLDDPLARHHISYCQQAVSQGLGG